MADFLVVKENNTHHLAIDLTETCRLPLDSKMHPSNMPYRILKGKCGKIIVAVNAINICRQFILTNTKILEKAEHITHELLSGEYYQFINELLTPIPLLPEDNYYNIIIIAEGKSYQVYSEGYVKEDDMLCGSTYMATIHAGMYDSYEKHNEKFMEDVFALRDEVRDQSSFPIVTINTETYKPKTIWRNKK